MRKLRVLCVASLAFALAAAACGSERVDDQGCVDVSGTWSMSNGSATVSCATPPDFVWTISQTGCMFTIAEKGVTGTVSSGHLYAEWSWSESCGGPPVGVDSTRSYHFYVDATVSGSTMSGKIAGLWASTGNCWGSGTCSVPVSGLRRVQ